MHFENGKVICHIDVFCIFAKVAIVTISKSCKIYSWNFLDKYEAQEEFVLQFHLNLVLERENGPFC